MDKYKNSELNITRVLFNLMGYNVIISTFYLLFFMLVKSIYGKRKVFFCVQNRKQESIDESNKKTISKGCVSA